jgi:preprotein translocase subunit YajC
MYITVLMAFTESSITAGVLTFFFYGLFPCALFIWIMGTPQRRRNKQKQQASMESQLDQPDRTDTDSD